MNKQRKLPKIYVLIISIVVLLELILIPTFAKYVVNIPTDNIIGYYTEFFFENDGNGKILLLDNTHGSLSGSVTINTWNYRDDENITGRDINYTVKMPYDAYNYHEKTNSEQAYITDRWDSSIKYYLNDASEYYTIEVLNSDGTSRENRYTLVGEIANTNSVILKITRKTDAGIPALGFDEVETINIVFETSSPYIDTKVFEVNVSQSLLSYSIQNVTKFGFNLKRLYIQTANVFLFDENYVSLSPAKINFTWSGLHLDNTSAIYNQFVDLNTATENSCTIYLNAQSEIYLDFYEYQETTFSLNASSEFIQAENAAYTPYRSQALI